MKNTQRTLRAEHSTKEHVLQLAFELSLNKWKLVFGHNGKMRMVTIDARDRVLHGVTVSIEWAPS
ncbi:MAG: hypothetical protein AMK69_20500 [Nitrospira bacterium SG8_3]|nr:MAG: hypothetical protein AMK69_20500 [Nitrospira bacterium SG8_3]